MVQLSTDYTPRQFLEHEFSVRFIKDLRSDHAGETGAVWIYRGVLRVARDPEVVSFATHHLEAERRHLAFFQAWLPKKHQSKLIPLWKVSGFLLGAVAALLGKKMLYVTISAVESFVVEHYQKQLDYLNREGNRTERSLLALLSQFQADESHHKLDAVTRINNIAGAAGIWLRLVEGGSRIAANAARLF